MTLVNHVHRLLLARRVGRIAEDIAQRSYVPVLNHVRAELNGMSAAEAKGYVRARAVEFIQAKVTAALKGTPGVQPWFRAEIEAQAMEELQHLIAAELVKARSTVRTFRRAA